MGGGAALKTFLVVFSHQLILQWGEGSLNSIPKKSGVLLAGR